MISLAIGVALASPILSVLDDPDAPHRFGRSPFKGMMPSMTRPPADPEAAKRFKPMAKADQEAVAAFLECYSANLFVRSTLYPHTTATLDALRGDGRVPALLGLSELARMGAFELDFASRTARWGK